MLSDDYAWLRARNWKTVLSTPEKLPKPIRDHLEAENAYCAQALAPLHPLIANLVAEMRGRIQEDEVAPPTRHGSFLYYERYRKGQEYAVLCRKPLPEPGAKPTAKPGREQIILDAPKLARGRDYFDLGDTAIAPDHRLLAYSTDTTGNEAYTIRLRNLDTGRDLKDSVPRTSGEMVWAADGRSFYYVALDAAQRPYKVMHHSLGSSTKQDRTLYHEAGTGWFVGLGQSHDTTFAVISIHDHETSEEWLIDLRDPAAMPVCVLPRHTGHEYDSEHRDGQLIIRTNWLAPDFKLVSLPILRNTGARPAGNLARARTESEPHALPLTLAALAQAETLVPQIPGRILLDHAIARDWLVWSDLGESGPQVHARHWASGREQHFSPRASTPAFSGEMGTGSPEENAPQQKNSDRIRAVLRETHAKAIPTGAVGDIVAGFGPEFHSAVLRITLSSPALPESVLDHDLDTGTETLLKTQQVPSGFDPARYVVERRFARAADGESVPITLLRRTDTRVNGTAPALLYGYGAYGAAMEADFDTERLSLVDRGFVYAIAHIRGGLEKGMAWYSQGKMLSKMNSFTDFIACADFLIHEGYAAPHKIVAQGVSAGGMLMGGVANMAGEKFAGIIAEVPFVDSLNTILDPTLPLTPPEWVEWGNPITDKAAFDAMRAYSPYDNVQAKPYPPMLVTGAVSDPRVTYWEPAKFVARLRATMVGGGPVLLHTNILGGHGGASGRFERLDDIARAYAFALHVTGIASGLDPAVG